MFQPHLVIPYVSSIDMMIHSSTVLTLAQPIMVHV